MTQRVPQQQTAANRIDEITQACVRQILDSWNEWDAAACMAATSTQDPEAYDDEMHAALWHVVKAAVEARIAKDNDDMDKMIGEKP